MNIKIKIGFLILAQLSWVSMVFFDSFSKSWDTELILFVSLFLFFYFILPISLLFVKKTIIKNGILIIQLLFTFFQFSILLNYHFSLDLFTILSIFSFILIPLFLLVNFNKGKKENDILPIKMNNNQIHPSHCKNCGNKVGSNSMACLNCGCDPRKGNNNCANCGEVIGNKEQVICLKCGVSLKNQNYTSIEMNSYAYISYLTLIGFIIALVSHNSNKTSLVAYHLRQVLGFMITSVAFYILFFIFTLPMYGMTSLRKIAEYVEVLYIVALIFGILFLLIFILSFLNALRGKETPAPIFGKLYERLFKKIFI